MTLADILKQPHNTWVLLWDEQGDEVRGVGDEDGGGGQVLHVDLDYDTKNSSIAGQALDIMLCLVAPE